MKTINRQAQILVNGRLAGLLTEYIVESSQRFIFEYDASYLASGSPIGLHFPLRDEPFKSNELHPFFENLASEGWLKKKQCEQAGLAHDDTFGLLLVNGQSLIGAISIVPNMPDERL